MPSSWLLAFPSVHGIGPSFQSAALFVSPSLCVCVSNLPESVSYKDTCLWIWGPAGIQDDLILGSSP